MPRLDQMSLGDIEAGGARYYERLGAMNGEDADWPDAYSDGPDGPEDTLQPWEVEPRDDWIADPPERDEP